MPVSIIQNTTNNKNTLTIDFGGGNVEDVYISNCYVYSSGDNVILRSGSTNKIVDLPYTEFTNPDGIALGSAQAVQNAIATLLKLPSSGGGSGGGAGSGSGTTDSSATINVAVGDIGKIFNLSNTGVRNVNLPDATAVAKWTTTLFKDVAFTAGASNININSVTPAQQVDGQSSQVIAVNGGMMEVYSDGHNWFISTGIF
jgi:hypothetical protein